MGGSLKDQWTYRCELCFDNNYSLLSIPELPNLHCFKFIKKSVPKKTCKHDRCSLKDMDTEQRIIMKLNWKHV